MMRTEREGKIKGEERRGESRERRRIWVGEERRGRGGGKGPAKREGTEERGRASGEGKWYGRRE